MTSHESFSPQDKSDLHRTRYEWGKELARHLAARSLHQAHDTVHGRDAVDIDAMRRAVWHAENEALRADPQEKWLPVDIREERGQGMSES